MTLISSRQRSCRYCYMDALTQTLTKRLENKLDDNYTRMLRAILNRSWQQHPTRHQPYDHRPPITKIIQARRTRHAGHCWRSKDELISDVLLWTPTYGRAKVGRPARTYIQQLYEDTGCSPKDLPEAMNEREKWRERVSGISVLAARHDDDDDDLILPLDANILQYFWRTLVYVFFFYSSAIKNLKKFVIRTKVIWVHDTITKSRDRRKNESFFFADIGVKAQRCSTKVIFLCFCQPRKKIKNSVSFRIQHVGRFNVLSRINWINSSSQNLLSIS